MSEVGKKFAVFDIDGTVVQGFSFGVEFIFQIVQQYGTKNDKLISADAYKEWHSTNNHEQNAIFDEKLRPYFKQLLPDLTRKQIETIGNAVSVKAGKHIFPTALSLIHEHKKQGRFLIAISYSPEIVLNKLLTDIGFDDWWAPKMIFDSKDIYVSRSSDNPIIWDKKKHLVDICNKHKLTFDNSFGYGDNLNDVPMLECVEIPVAVNPDALFTKEATKRGWKIING